MVRQGISVPDSVQGILQQENRFKAYKDHLELALSQFYSVVKSIPDAVRGLFQSHVDQALISFQPGVSTLAWNSMNIGKPAYLSIEISTQALDIGRFVDESHQYIFHMVRRTSLS